MTQKCNKSDASTLTTTNKNDSIAKADDIGAQLDDKYVNTSTVGSSNFQRL